MRDLNLGIKVIIVFVDWMWGSIVIIKKEIVKWISIYKGKKKFLVKNVCMNEFIESLVKCIRFVWI